MKRGIIFACLALMLSCVWAQAQSVEARRSEKERLEKEIEQIDKLLSSADKQHRDVFSEHALAQKKVETRRKLVGEIDAQIADIQKKINSENAQIRQLNARIDTLENRYKLLVRSAYANRDANLWFAYIFASESLTQAYRRYGYFRGISSSLDRQANQIREARSESERRREALVVLKAETDAARKERVGELSTIQKEEAALAKNLKDLNTQKKKYEKQLRDKKTQMEKLNREIEKMIAEATSAPSKGGGKKTKPLTEVEKALSKNFASNKGKLPWPVDGQVVEKFGQNFMPGFKNIKLPPNKGVTIAASVGSRVQAVFDGEVYQIAVMHSGGNCVLVRHGEYFSYYGNVKDIKVKTGDKVTTTQTIGTVDGSAKLIFQIWKGKTVQNPSSWLK